MKSSTSLVLSAFVVALGAHAHSSSGNFQPIFRRQDIGQSTSGFDPTSPNAPPKCKKPCTTIFAAGKTCKDAQCLCTAKNAKALGKCINCVVAEGKGSPFEGSFTQQMFYGVCERASVSNLPTPTISLPPNFSLPPGVSTGSDGGFTISTAATADVSFSGSATFSETVSGGVAATPVPTSTATSTVVASSSSITSSSESHSSSHSTTSTSPAATAARATASSSSRNAAYPTAGANDLMPMAVLGVVALAVL
ncbi:hypothetical protein HGRIS_011119 [Hohenbuehelia grisea]|uniref:Extracellular membrane protein CFEM domain-containing protein n=1 Tax=Hohenbuehelia grisea TaxID=104357 RepID=A0ABR3IYX3_9AGAR